MKGKKKRSNSTMKENERVNNHLSLFDWLLITKKNKNFFSQFPSGWERRYDSGELKKKKPNWSAPLISPFVDALISCQCGNNNRQQTFENVSEKEKSREKETAHEREKETMLLFDYNTKAFATSSFIE
jgi:hypothetical protein